MIVLAGPGAPVLPETTSGIHGSHRSEYGVVFHIVPPTFCSAVVKLVAMQMQALGVHKSSSVLQPFDSCICHNEKDLIKSCSSFHSCRTSSPWNRSAEGVCLLPMISVSTCWSTSYCLYVSGLDVPEKVMSIRHPFCLLLNVKYHDKKMQE